MGGTRTGAVCREQGFAARFSARTRQVTLEGEGSETPEHSPARVTVGLAGLWPRSASQLEAGQLLHAPPTPPTPELRPNGDQGGRGGPGVQALEVTLRVFRRTGGSEESMECLEGRFLTSDSCTPWRTPPPSPYLTFVETKLCLSRVSAYFFWALHSQGMLLE